jgi:hypothetical protein
MPELFFISSAIAFYSSQMSRLSLAAIADEQGSIALSRIEVIPLPMNTVLLGLGLLAIVTDVFFIVFFFLRLVLAGFAYSTRTYDAERIVLAKNVGCGIYVDFNVLARTVLIGIFLFLFCGQISDIGSSIPVHFELLYKF